MPEDKTVGRIECGNDLLAGGFVQTPIMVLRDKDLSAGAKLTYGALLWYLWRGGSYPGQAVMADEFGVSERSVRNYLGELANSGYLAVKRHGLGQPNTYTILCPWEQTPDRQNLPVKAANLAGQGGKSGRSLIEQDSKRPKTLSQNAPNCEALADAFFAALSEEKPARKRRERALGIIHELTAEGFTADAIREACRLAGERGARGPDLLPYLIGEAHSLVETQTAQKVKQAQVVAATEKEQQEAADRHEEGIALVEALAPEERTRLEAQARTTLGLDPDRHKGPASQAVITGWIMTRLRDGGAS